MQQTCPPIAHRSCGSCARSTALTGMSSAQHGAGGGISGAAADKGAGRVHSEPRGVRGTVPGSGCTDDASSDGEQQATPVYRCVPATPPMARLCAVCSHADSVRALCVGLCRGSASPVPVRLLRAVHTALYSCGNNEVGQLGIGAGLAGCGAVCQPRGVRALTGVMLRQLSAGAQHVLAVSGELCIARCVPDWLPLVATAAAAWFHGGCCAATVQ